MNNFSEVSYNGCTLTIGSADASESDFDGLAASRIVEQIKAKPDSVIGLSTGRTTGNIHRIVARQLVIEDVDCSRVTFFGLDEVTGVPRTFSGACYAMFKTELVDTIGLDDSQFLMLPTISDDFPAACAAFCTELQRRGGIDLLELGLGENGHLGFNQPGSALDSVCRVTDMDDALLERLTRESGCTGLRGATLGIKDIMHVRRILLVAKGVHKRDAVHQMLCGPVTCQLPASVLQLHPACEFILDAAAAAGEVLWSNSAYAHS